MAPDDSSKKLFEDNYTHSPKGAAARQHILAKPVIIMEELKVFVRCHGRWCNITDTVA